MSRFDQVRNTDQHIKNTLRGTYYIEYPCTQQMLVAGCIERPCVPSDLCGVQCEVEGNMDVNIFRGYSSVAIYRNN